MKKSKEYFIIIVNLMFIIFILESFTFIFPFTTKIVTIINIINSILYIIQIYFVVKLFKAERNENKS